MEEIKCKQCANYGLYKMITSKNPYSYSGEIPCLTCSRFRVETDKFTPKQPIKDLSNTIKFNDGMDD